MDKKLSGIYCIENIQNGKKYYGQSVNLDKRRYTHFENLKKNKHRNLHLQSSFNKYGVPNFIFKILLYCEHFELQRYEQFFVDNDFSCYNICKECTTTTLGIKYTSKQKEKISELNSGKNNPMYGKKHSDKTKAKMSNKAFSKNNMRGKRMSEDDRKRLSRISFGENNGRAKLTWKNVYWIRKHRKEYKLKELSNMFQVSTAAITNICSGKSWKEGADHSCWSIGQNGDIQ